MKIIISVFISIILISTSFAQQDLPPAYPEEIIGKGEVGEIAYFKGDTKPFTGLLVDKKTNKKLGEYWKGYKNGLFIENYANGKKKSEGTFIIGVKDGVHTQWFINGQIQSSYTYNSGHIISGNYVTYLENGQKETEEIYKNGQIENYSKYKDGKLIESLEHSIELYPKGQKKCEGYLKNGIKDRFWTFWYKRGEKEREGNYKNGNEDGQWVSWYENGQKGLEGNYIDGKKDGLWISWYSNGHKKSEGYYKEGNQEGKWDAWFEDGKKEFEGSYVNGLKDGYCTLNLSDGGSYQGEWKNGEMNGKGSFYRDDGNGDFISYKGNFVNGKYEGQGTLTGSYTADWGKSPYSFTGEWKDGKQYNGLYYDKTNLGKGVTEIKNGKWYATSFIR